MDRRQSGSEEAIVPESLRRVACLSVTHKTGPSERIGAVIPDDPAAVASEVKRTDPITECVVLTTCNRVEVYGSARTANEVEVVVTAADEALGAVAGTQEYIGIDAVDHVARVACALESVILGEDQILGQVNRAFDSARRAGLADGVLSRVGDMAVRVGRQCREETGINDGTVGYGSTICGCIEDRLNRAPEHVLIVGAGEMAEIAAAAIHRRWDPRIDVANRSPRHDLTTGDGTYWPLATLEEALAAADVVVTATGASDALLTEEHVKHCEWGTPVLDVANPPDVSPAACRNPGIHVADLNDVATRVRKHTRSRQKDVEAVEELIDTAIERHIVREREHRAEAVLRTLHSKAARTRERELEQAVTRLEKGDCDPEVVMSDFASALTDRLLADPTEALRTAARNGDAEMIAATYRLFDLNDEGES